MVNKFAFSSFYVFLLCYQFLMLFMSHLGAVPSLQALFLISTADLVLDISMQISKSLRGKGLRIVCTKLPSQ